ncbi:MAG: threonylcarbamoyl-AMP synthase, partial [Clostridia bacterium]|nr:threonylcarbamoyl-AMP synthase [Clostridia bacterium]
MNTSVISTDNPTKAAAQGAAVLQAGGLVAFPTETVYGLGANGLDGAAVDRIFEAKGRPNDNPLILHVAEKADAFRLWAGEPPHAQQLMDTFWPGPLTLIYYRSDIVPDEVTAGLDTVAVRMPDSTAARALIAAAGTPIAAPSANLSGKPSPTTAVHVLQDMDGRIPLILDGGPCRYGVESTVLSLVGVPTILRPGAVTKEMLAAVLGEVALSPSVLAPLAAGEKAASPGMKYKHYAPNAQVLVVVGEAAAAAARLSALYDRYTAQNMRVRIAATAEALPFYGPRRCALLGTRRDPTTLCSRLFSLLRELDQEADVILSVG